MNDKSTELSNYITTVFTNHVT